MAFMSLRAAALSVISALALLVPSGVPAAPGRIVAPRAGAASRQMQFGPFAVLSPKTARLVGVTDGSSPAHFLAMIEAWPTLRALELVDCPGTRDDIANLRLGRMIRQHGIATIAPAGASIRSGAVDIFIAGSLRHAAPDASFAVHSWLSADGRDASRTGAGDPARAAYVRYYTDMGMAPAKAGAFYALTISVPNNRTITLGARDLARFASIAPAL